MSESVDAHTSNRRMTYKRVPDIRFTRIHELRLRAIIPRSDRLKVFRIRESNVVSMHLCLGLVHRFRDLLGPGFVIGVVRFATPAAFIT